MTIQGPLDPVPNHAKVLLKYHSGTAPAGGSRFYVRYLATTPSASDLQTFANHVGAQWDGFMAPLMSVGQSMSSVTVVDIGSSSGAQAAWTVGSAGQRAGGEGPVSNAVLVNWKMAKRYRGGKPRTYFLAGTDTDSLDGKSWINSFTTQFTSALGSFRDTICITYGALTVVSFAVIQYYGGSIPNDSPSRWAPKNVPKQLHPPVATDLLNFAVSSRVSSQRKRLVAKTA